MRTNSMEFQKYNVDLGSKTEIKTVFKTSGRQGVYLKAPNGEGHFQLRFTEDGDLEVRVTEGYIAVCPRTSNVIQVRKEYTHDEEDLD